MNTISNGELSDPLCDSVNRGLTLVRLIVSEMVAKTTASFGSEVILVILTFNGSLKLALLKEPLELTGIGVYVRKEAGFHTPINSPLSS